MIKILSTHRLRFDRVHEGVEETFSTRGGNQAESAPDWIAEDDYFKSNAEEGRVILLGAEPVSQPEPVEPTEPSESPRTEEDNGGAS